MASFENLKDSPPFESQKMSSPRYHDRFPTIQTLFAIKFFLGEIRLATILTILLNFSCSKDKIHDSAQSSFYPTMPTSECGLEEYLFQSTENMGTLLSSQKRDDLSLSQETIAMLRSTYDLPLPEPQNGIETHYIQYTSQDKGHEVAGTGMIIFPEGLSNAPVLMWLHPTMGFADECAPTATGLVGAALPALFASLGYIVVAPDYLGMSGWTGDSTELHPYVISEPTAILSIDSLRALPHLIDHLDKEISFDPNRIILWGASEGGFAALTTDRYFPHYAPEFQTIATLATTPVTDMMALAQRGMTDLSDTTGGIVAVQVTMHQWYNSETPLTSMLQPNIATIVEETMMGSCDDFGAILTDVQRHTDIFTENYVTGILADDERAEPWSCFLKDNSLLDKIPHVQTSPTYIVTAELDDLAWPLPVHNDIPKLCAQGYQIVHSQCGNVGHVAGSLDSLALQWQWLQDRLNGLPLEHACEVSEPILCE